MSTRRRLSYLISSPQFCRPTLVLFSFLYFSFLSVSVSSGTTSIEVVRHSPTCVKHISQISNENIVHLCPASSRSSSSDQRIVSWIKHMQKGDFALSNTASPATPPASTKRKRTVMVETSGNERIQIRRSPRKQLRIDRTDEAVFARTPTTPQGRILRAHNSHSVEIDIDENTPRASISSRGRLALDASTTFVPSSKSQPALVGSLSLDGDRSISGDSEESGALLSAGSRSPVRCWADFAAADIPTINK